MMTKKTNFRNLFMVTVFIIVLAASSSPSNAAPAFYEFGLNSTYNYTVLNNDTLTGANGDQLSAHTSDFGLTGQWEFGSWNGDGSAIFNNMGNVTSTTSYEGIEFNLTHGLDTFDDAAGNTYAVCFIYNTSGHSNIDLGIGGSSNNKYGIKFYDYSGKFSNVTAELYDWAENTVYRVCYDIKKDEKLVRAVVLDINNDPNPSTYASVLYDSGYIFNFATATDANASSVYFRNNAATAPILVDGFLVFNSTAVSTVPPTTPINTSILGNDIKINDFNLTNQYYKNVTSFNITEGNYIFSLTATARKTSGNPASIFMEIRKNGTVLYERWSKRFRLDDIYSAVSFDNVEINGGGEIDVAFRLNDTATGEVTDVNAYLLAMNSSNGTEIQYNITSFNENAVSVTYSYLRTVYNQSFNASVYSMFNVITNNNGTGDTSVSMTDNESGSIQTMTRTCGGGCGGSLVTSYINDNVKDINITGVYAIDMTSSVVNGTLLTMSLKDNTNNTIPNGYSSTFYGGGGLDLTTDYQRFDTVIHNMTDGDALYIDVNGMFFSSSAASGTSDMMVNVTGADCTRYSSRSSLGNAALGINKIRFVCTGLSAGNTYNVSAWGKKTGSVSMNGIINTIMIIETKNNTITFNPDIKNPELSVYYPSTAQWSNDYLNGTCYDESLIAQVSVNDSRFVFNPDSTFANFSFMYNSTFSGEVSVEVTCTDVYGNANTTTVTAGFDVAAPNCTPIIDYTSYNSFTHDWNVTCTDDLNLYSINVTCVGGTNYTFYAENINMTEFNFTNSTGLINDNMTCTWTTRDAHTLNDITDELNPYTSIIDDAKIKIKGHQILELVPEDNVSIDKIKLNFKTDRVKFDVDYEKNKNNEFRTYRFNVNAEHKIVKIGNDRFPGWFVIDDHYWVDFALDNDDGMTWVNSYRYNDTSYVVTVYTRLDKLKFRSIGIVNTNVQSQTFSVINTNEISMTTCPSNLTEMSFYWLMLLLSMFLIFIGLVYKIGIFGFFGSLMLMIMSWYLSACIHILGYIAGLLSIIMMVWFAFIMPIGFRNDTYR